MGHKRHKFRGNFENQAPGLTGPGITEPGYPDPMPNIATSKGVVTISIEHPETNPPGVIIQEVTEEEVLTQRKDFGINVGEAMQSLLDQKEATSNSINPNRKDNKMENKNETKAETVNNETNNNEVKQETNMNQEVKTETPKTEPKQEQKKETPKQEQPKAEESKKDTKAEEPKKEGFKPNKMNVDTETEGSDAGAPSRNGVSLGRQAAGAFTVGASYGAGVIVGMAAAGLLICGIKKICSGGDKTTETAAETAQTLLR